MATRPAGQQRGIHADIRVGQDAYRLNDQVGRNDRQIRWHAGMLRPEDLDPWTEPDIVPEDEIARIKETLRANPDAIADHEAAIMATLQDGVIANEHAVAEFERLRM